MLRHIRTLARITMAVGLASTAVYVYPAASVVLDYAVSGGMTGSAETTLLALRGEDYASEAKNALSEDDAELATSILALAQDRGVMVDPDLSRQVSEANAFSWTKSAGQAWSGLVSGSADSPAAFAGSLVADLSVAGDVRDLYGELSKYPDYDELTVGLAALGVAATGATFVSGMNALPAKEGVSLMKSAKRAGKLPPTLQRELREIAAGSIDGAQVSTAWRSMKSLDTTAVRTSIARIVRPEGISRLASAATDLGEVAGKQGYRGTVQTLRLSKTTGDLKVLERMSDRYGDRFRAVARFAGKAGTIALGILGFVAAMAWWIAAILIWLATIAWFVIDTVLWIIKAVNRSTFTAAKKTDLTSA